MANQTNKNKQNKLINNNDETIENNDNNVENIVDLLENDEVVVETTVESEIEEVNVDQLISEINDVVNDISGKEDSEKNYIVTKTDFESNYMVKCKSIFLGKLGWINPVTNARYTWKEFGVTVNLPFSEIQSINNYKESYFNLPYLLILDADVVKYFNLVELYEKVLRINKIEGLIKSKNIDAIRAIAIDAVEVGMKEVLISRVRKLRAESKLDSIDIIKALEEELKFAIE